MELKDNKKICKSSVRHIGRISVLEVLIKQTVSLECHLYVRFVIVIVLLGPSVVRRIDIRKSVVTVGRGDRGVYWGIRC